MRPLASLGVAAKIGDVHIDGVLSVRSGRAYERSTVATEQGAPSTAHRQRVPQVLEVDVLISDVEPVFAALLTGLWEFNHAEQTRQRIFALQRAGTSVLFFDGRKVWRNPGGQSAWIIDDVREAETPDEKRRWRATIVLGEDTKFQTTFTSIDGELAASEADAADGIVDKGQQSTELVPPELAIQIPT